MPPWLWLLVFPCRLRGGIYYVVRRRQRTRHCRNVDAIVRPAFGSWYTPTVNLTVTGRSMPTIILSSSPVGDAENIIRMNMFNTVLSVLPVAGMADGHCLNQPKEMELW